MKFLNLATFDALVGYLFGTDLRLYRTGTKTGTYDDGAGGAATLTIIGTLTVSKKISQTTGSIAYAATVTPNCDDYNRVDIGTLTGNVTIANPTGTPVNGQVLKIKLVQDGTGSRTLTWGAGYNVSTSVVPATADISTAANADQILVFEYDSTLTKWRLTGVTRAI